MTSDYPTYVECQWCGNRWYQDEDEPQRCSVCQHLPYEGTHEEHMNFSDLEAWGVYLKKQKELLTEK